MEDIIRDYIKAHISDHAGDVIQGLEESLQSYVGDRRYKLIRMSFSSDMSGTSYSGILSFRGTRYYISVIQPWAECPDGSVTAERMS